jgi:hypothetical protein
MFTHEKFEAYQLAIQFTHVALQCLDELPPGNATLRNQLRRAAFILNDQAWQSQTQINRQHPLNRMLIQITR